MDFSSKLFSDPKRVDNQLLHDPLLLLAESAINKLLYVMTARQPQPSQICSQYIVNTANFIPLCDLELTFHFLHHLLQSFIYISILPFNLSQIKSRIKLILPLAQVQTPNATLQVVSLDLCVQVSILGKKIGFIEIRLFSEVRLLLCLVIEGGKL